MTIFLTRTDLDQNPRASCGPAALAALLEMPLAELHTCFPRHTAERTWTNLVQMQSAITTLKVKWDPTGWAEYEDKRTVGHERAWPHLGLVLLQFHGTWDTMPVNHPAQLQRSHWVAVSPLKNSPPGGEPWVFDVNALEQHLNHGWLPKDCWETRILKPLIACHKRANGSWWVRAGLEVQWLC